MPITYSELRVIVAVAHSCFDNDIPGTVVQDNVNPTETVERALLLVSSTVHGESPAGLIRDNTDRPPETPGYHVSISSD